MATRRSIRQRVIQECQLGFNSTSTSGSATTVVDTVRLQNTGADSRNHVGFFINRPAAAAAADNVRTVTSYAGSTGTLTHQGANYTNSPTTEVYELIKWIHPDDLNSAINRAMEKLWYETWLPLSLVDDYDMEASGVSNWTVTNATQQKITTAGWYGDQALEVTTTSANGYTQSNSVPVKPGAFGFAGVTVAASASGDKFEFTVWDVTNAAAIGSVVEETTMLRHNVNVSFTVPDGCYQVALRLGAEASGDIAVYDNAILHVQHQNRFNAPTWLTQREQLLSVRWQVNLGSPVTNSSSQSAYPEYAVDWPEVTIAELEIDPTGTVPMRIVLADYASSYPVWVQAHRNYATFTADTSTGGTTDANEDYVVAAVKVEVYEILNARYRGRFETELKKAARSFGALARKNAPRGPRSWRRVM